MTDENKKMTSGHLETLCSPRESPIILNKLNAWEHSAWRPGNCFARSVTCEFRFVTSCTYPLSLLIC